MLMTLSFAVPYCGYKLSDKLSSNGFRHPFISFSLPLAFHSPFPMKLRSGRSLDIQLPSNTRPRKRYRRTAANDALNDDCLLLIFQAMEHTPTTLSTLRLVCRRWTRLLEVACVVSHCALVYPSCTGFHIPLISNITTFNSGEIWYWTDNSLEHNIKSLLKATYYESINTTFSV